jgi:CRP/FNR family transcriptional regulator
MEATRARHPFDHLPPDVQTRLRGLLHTRTFKAGEQLFAQGEPGSAIYLLVTGRVKIVRVTPEGHESILCMRGPGEYFCPVPVLDGGTQLGAAVAISDGVLLWAERDAFCALCESSPELLATAQGDCLAEVRHLLNRLEAFAFRSVNERLAVAVLDESRHQHTDGLPADELRLTQQELAELVGASRETVSRILSRLEREGVVALRRGRVIIRDRARLTQLAQGRITQARKPAEGL